MYRTLMLSLGVMWVCSLLFVAQAKALDFQKACQDGTTSATHSLMPGQTACFKPTGTDVELTKTSFDVTNCGSVDIIFFEDSSGLTYEIDVCGDSTCAESFVLEGTTLDANFTAFWGVGLSWFDLDETGDADATGTTPVLQVKCNAF